MKQLMIGKWLAAGALIGGLAQWCAVAQESRPPTLPPTAVTPAPAGPSSQPTPSATLAAKPQPSIVDEILNLTKAGVGPEVIKTYVEHAPAVAFPTAAEIIALKDAGVPNEITVALMKRAGELQAQALPTLAPPPPVATTLPPNRDAFTGTPAGIPNPENYDFWWYHYAYPRALASANQRMLSAYAPYGGYGSFGPSFSLGFYPSLPFRPHHWGGPYRGR